MTERTLLADEPGTARLQETARDSADWPAPAAALVGGWTGHALAGSRGAGPALGRAIGTLQATAGNGAVAQLLATGLSMRRRDAPECAHAAHVGNRRTNARPAAAAWTPSVQTAGGDTPVPAAGVGAGAEPMGGGAPPPGPSWTKVGPPSPSSFAVSGTLREVATTLEARGEAGSETPTPSRDIETWAPDEGEERITAARVTIDQVVELPTWTDKAAATANQQAEWDRFSAAISTHEAGHVATDRTSFANAHTKMLHKTPDEGDEQLDNVATQAKADNDAYDVATGQGKSQGTDINANIDEVTKVP